MTMKNIRRIFTASVTALAIAAAPAAALAAETETAAETLTVADTTEDLIEAAAQQAQTGHEGYLTIQVGDAMRNMLAVSAGVSDSDDMSWIQDATIRLKEDANETGGADLEAALFFNGTELYHLNASFDARQMILYAVCPELQDRTIAVPVGELAEGMQNALPSGISEEILEVVKELAGEFVEFIASIPPESVQNAIMSYVVTLGSYLQTEEGSAVVTAGNLSAEAKTVSYKISSEAMQKMVPQLLTMLSQDQLLEQAMKSTFVSHLLSLATQQGGEGTGITGEDLYTVLQSQLAQLAEGDFSDLFGFNVTVGTTEEGLPARLSVGLEQRGVSAELFCLDIVSDGAEHAAEFKLGPVLAYSMGLTDTDQASFLLEGSVEQNRLNETFSLNLNGSKTPVFLVQDLDLEQLEQGRIVGTFTLNTDEDTFTWDYSVAEEDDGRIVDMYIDGELWVSAAMNLYESADVEMDAIDTSDPFIVCDEETLAAYMRDANVISMLEKLADAGVPQEYVDILTSGEASTESSRENVEEKDAAS